MKISEVVNLINNKEKTLTEIAAEFNCTRFVLGKILKDNGYHFNNKEKKYLYIKDGDPEEKDIRKILERRNNNHNIIRKKSEKNKSEVKEVFPEKKENGLDNTFSEEEIKIIKMIAYERKDRGPKFELNEDFSQLPPKKPSKKATYEISKKTFEQFEMFARVCNDKYRMSKNDLIEIALARLIRDFS